MKPFVLLPEAGNPLVYLDFALLHGSFRDPQGKEGVASLTLSMLLRGTQKRKAKDFHSALDLLGAEIHLGKYKDSLRVYGTVLAAKLDPFMDLLQEMLTEPEFSVEEFAKIKRQFHGSLVDELSSDDDIADRRFQEYMLWGNDYGRLTSGSLESLEKIQLDDLRDFHRRYFCGADFVVGAGGGFRKAHISKRIKTILAAMPGKKQKWPEAKAPAWKKGKSLLLLDKEGRTQSQILVGSQGVSYLDKDYLPLVVANHVFGGGSFSSRLMKEVREKRGWSYGAYSWFRAGKLPLYFAMSAVPANKDTVPALRLMLKMFQDFTKKGVSKAEFDFSKQSLVSQSAFLQDTLRKRLDNKVSERVLGLPASFYDKYQKNLQSVTHARVQKSVRKYLDSGKIFALVLGGAEALRADIKALRGFKVWEKNFAERPQELS